jgi:hypothetical protein
MTIAGPTCQTEKEKSKGKRGACVAALLVPWPLAWLARARAYVQDVAAACCLSCLADLPFFFSFFYFSLVSFVQIDLGY